MKTPILLALCLLAAVPASAAPPTRKAEDVCLVNLNYPGGSPLNTFVLHDVEPLTPTRSVPIHGLYLAGTARVNPLHGSAVMAADGTIRIGLVIHSTATSTNDFTLSALTASDLSGDFNYDSDGDFRPDGTLPIERVDCSTITIP